MQRLINQHAKLFWVIPIIEGDCHAYAKNPDYLQSIANNPGFSFEEEFF